MKIGFDAKRAYHNSTGLGHYSRTLIRSLATDYPENEYMLFTPSVSDLFHTASYPNVHAYMPVATAGKLFPKNWRNRGIIADLQKEGVQLYHGLSHQIPVGIKESGIASVVTIHDLIFERYPGQHGKVNVLLYRKKFKYACKNADIVIAISQQTKQDLIDLYHVPENKIRICYQSCDPVFSKKINEEEKKITRAKYDLPEKFFLSVGSITERKNLLTVCRAIKRRKTDLPLVVIGTGRKYKKKLQEYLKKNDLVQQVIFLSDHPEAASAGFRSSTDFPAIYQSAAALLYPSLFEGFGIPILEALESGLPVITSNVSCMPETGGDAALYIDPFDDKALAEKMRIVAEDQTLAAAMVEKGYAHAKKFSPGKCAAAVMNVYKELVQ